MSPLSDRWKTYRALSLSNRVALLVASVLGVVTAIVLSPVLVPIWLCQLVGSVFREPPSRPAGPPIPRDA